MQYRYAVCNINVNATHSLSHYLGFHRGWIKKVLPVWKALETKGSPDTLFLQPSSGLKQEPLLTF